MTSRRVSFSLPDDLLQATKVYATRAGQRESQVVEAPLRAFLRDPVVGAAHHAGARSANDLTDEGAMQLAVGEQHAWREEQRRAGRH